MQESLRKKLENSTIHRFEFNNTKIVRKIYSYLHLNQVGLLELLFALYPIMSGYAYGSVRLDLLMLLIMDAIAFTRRGSRMSLKPLCLLAVFVVMHELFLYGLLPDSPMYVLNTIIGYVINFFSIYIIVSALNFDKLVGALNWVALLSIGGIVYHFILILSGSTISPIKLPFLPDLAKSTRLFEEGMRPCSFYWEPQAYVSYMMIPLFLSLYERKYIWSTVIIISMFFSASTTGIILSFLIIGIYISTQKVKLRYKIFVGVLSVGLCYFLLNSRIFKDSITKLEETEIETSLRFVNGPALITHMPLNHLIWGMPSGNPYDYSHSGYISGALLIEKNNSIFVATFWLVLAKFGIFGLLLFLNVYYQIIKQNRQLWPYSISLLPTLFSEGTLLVGIFSFQLIFMYAFIKNAIALQQRDRYAGMLQANPECQ